MPAANMYIGFGLSSTGSGDSVGSGDDMGVGSGVVTVVGVFSVLWTAMDVIVGSLVDVGKVKTSPNG